MNGMRYAQKLRMKKESNIWHDDPETKRQQAQDPKAAPESETETKTHVREAASSHDERVVYPELEMGKRDT